MSKSKNLLVRFYNIERGMYGKPFAICNAGYHVEKYKWSSKGLIVEQIGTTGWDCNNHENHAAEIRKQKRLQTNTEPLRELVQNNNA